MKKVIKLLLICLFFVATEVKADFNAFLVESEYSVQ